jgi:hypothetical protein
MNISNEYPVTIFKNVNDYGTFYRVGLSKKDVEGKYINGYKDIRFKKGVELEDKTKLYIKKAWLDFYIKDKKTIDYIFCSEFELIEETIENAKTPLANMSDSEIVQGVMNEDDPFKSFGEEMELSDLDLPF